MRKRQLLKWVGTSFMAAIMMLSYGWPVQAQEMNQSAVEDALADSNVIDTERKGSMTIYKYDMTSAEAAGAYVEGNHTATGEADHLLQDIMSPYAVEGVEFSYVRCGDIETYSSNGGTSIKIVYEIPETLRELLGLKEQDAVSMTEENLSAKCDHKGVYHYTSQQLNDALKTTLETDTIKAKSALENYVNVSENADKMPLTNQMGYTHIDHLQTGLYLLVETKVPEQVTTTCYPWFVSLPFTNESANWNEEAGGEKWLYDVTCYPKNQTGNPTLDKLVRQNQNDGGDGSYHSTATASEGDALDYLVVSKLPHITSTSTALTEYAFKDILSKGLTYQNDVKFAVYREEEDAKNNRIENAEAIWSHDELTQKSEKDEKTGQTTIDVAVSDKGLKKINDLEQGYSDAYLVMYYTAKLNSDQTTVMGDKGNPNDVVLTWKRTSDSYFNTLEDKCVVYTFGIHLSKSFSDNQGDATKVAFSLYNKENEMYIVAEAASAGQYYVTGKTNKKEQATIFRPAESGILIVNGMEGDSYQLTERSTDNGYSILKDSVLIEITSTTETIIPSVAGTTGLENITDEGQAINRNYGGTGIVDATGTNVSESKGIQSSDQANGRTIGKTAMYEGEKKNACAKVDGIDAVMSASDESVNARVDINILNSKTFLLPQTGGAGLYVATVIGAIAIGIGFAMTKKKANNHK